MQKVTIPLFQKEIWKYYKTHKRQMPWRETTDPYKIMLSEIMLQQTQVSRVVGKYEAFLERFPTIEVLAEAPLGDILKLWQGLGYNRRAKFLHLAAKEISEKHGGKFPNTLLEIDALPGIGPATASAILAYAYNTGTPFIETNIRRVFIHFFFPRSKKVSDTKILPLVEKALDQKNPREWYWALMDYGAYLAKEVPNPNRKSKHYTKQSKFEGSNRQIRGRILRILAREGNQNFKTLIQKTDPKDPRAIKNIEALIVEGLLKKEGSVIQLA